MQHISTTGNYGACHAGGRVGRVSLGIHTSKMHYKYSCTGRSNKKMYLDVDCQ